MDTLPCDRLTGQAVTRRPGTSFSAVLPSDRSGGHTADLKIKILIKKSSAMLPSDRSGGHTAAGDVFLCRVRSDAVGSHTAGFSSASVNWALALIRISIYQHQRQFPALVFFFSPPAMLHAAGSACLNNSQNEA